MSLYSVFVGHISQDVTKAELSQLFSGCGVVKELVILPSEHSSTFNYGFVRYAELESAMKAVSELHKWSLKGTRLIVDLSSFTREKLQKENKGCCETGSRKDGKSPKHGNLPTKPDSASSKTSGLIQDMMFMGRVKESCTALNLEATKHNTGAKSKHFFSHQKVSLLDTEKLMDDIAEAYKGKPQQYEGRLSEEASANKVYEKLMMSYSADPILRDQQGKEFMRAMKTVMDSMSGFMKETISAEDEMLSEDDNQSQTMADDAVTFHRAHSCSSDSHQELDLRPHAHVSSCQSNTPQYQLAADTSHHMYGVERGGSVCHSHTCGTAAHPGVASLSDLRRGFSCQCVLDSVQSCDDKSDPDFSLQSVDSFCCATPTCGLQQQSSVEDDRGSNSSTSDENEYFNGDSGVETDLNGSKDSQHGVKLREMLNPPQHLSRTRYIVSNQIPESVFSGSNCRVVHQVNAPVRLGNYCNVSDKKRHTTSYHIKDDLYCDDDQPTDTCIRKVPIDSEGITSGMNELIHVENKPSSLTLETKVETLTKGQEDKQQSDILQSDIFKNYFERAILGRGKGNYKMGSDSKTFQGFGRGVKFN